MLAVYLFDKVDEKPRFRDTLHHPVNIEFETLVIYYSHQCPFALDCAKKMKDAARSLGIEVETKLLQTSEDVQAGPSPFGIFGVVWRGRFITHEMMTYDKFVNFLKCFN